MTYFRQKHRLKYVEIDFTKLRGFINVESLTVSDLMEDKIISLPYAIDSAVFF